MTKYHKKYLKELDVCVEIETYIQDLTVRKTLELISLDKRRGTDEEKKEEIIKESIEKLGKTISIPKFIENEKEIIK